MANQPKEPVKESTVEEILARRPLILSTVELARLSPTQQQEVRLRHGTVTEPPQE